MEEHVDGATRTDEAFVTFVELVGLDSVNASRRNGNEWFSKTNQLVFWSRLQTIRR
jgi:hypothetical protein